MTIEEIVSKFQDVRPTCEGEWMCLCPAHKDKNGSLHITTKPDGGLLFHCFAGCSGEAVLSAVGLTWSDMPSNRPRQPRRYGLTLQEYADAKKIPVKSLMEFGLSDGEHACKNGRSYPGVRIAYYDAAGAFSRYRWRMTMHKEETAGSPSRFLWDNAGAPMQLYGLWRQHPMREWTILVEGESDCHALWLNNYPALGIPGVSNYKPLRDDAVMLQYGSEEKPQIYVHIEKDIGGFNLFMRLTGQDGRNLPSAALDRMKFFSIRGYKDPSDLWCATCDRPEEFMAAMTNALTSARPWREFPRPEAWAAYEKDKEEAKAAKTARKADAAPKATPEATPDAAPDGSAEKGAEKAAEAPASRGGARSGSGRRPTDYKGAATAYFRRHVAKKIPTLRFWRQGWWEYDGHCYMQKLDSDMEGEVMAFMQEEETIDTFNVKQTPAELHGIMMNLRAEGLCYLPQGLPAPTWLSTRESAAGWLPTKNCIVNLEEAARAQREVEWPGEKLSGELAGEFTRPLSPDLLATFAMPYEYDPAATCPKFLAWLESTQPKQEMREALQMLMGLCLVPDTSYNVCFFLSGEGGTGKTTFLRILEAFIGEQNTCHVPLLKFDQRFCTWPLAEKLVNIVGEMPSDDPQGRLRYIEGDFKDSISGENIDCEKKGKDVVKARCIARHVFATNSLPKFFDKSEGIWDRLRIMPFTTRFRGTSIQVQNIEQTFLPDELPGIFNFALAGLGLLRLHTTFPETEDMAQAKREHRIQCDPEAEYIHEFYAPDAVSETQVNLAYDHYKDYLIKNGFKLRSANSLKNAIMREFGRQGVTMGYYGTHGSGVRTQVFRGLRRLWLTPSQEEM